MTGKHVSVKRWPSLKRWIAAAMAALLFCSGSAAPARAQEGQRLSLLRDAETENGIRTLASPLWRAAGLQPDAVRILLVNDPSLNAFVGGGQNLFIHAGLLMRAENASQLLGVI